MTTRQRAALRAMANTIDPVLHIGKDGISDNLVKQAWDALEARELIKATVQKNAPLCHLPPGAGELQNPPGRPLTELIRTAAWERAAFSIPAPPEEASEATRPDTGDCPARDT